MRKYANHFVVLLLCTLSLTVLFAQERKVSGTVMDDKGTPLSGATVTVKNTNVATTTDGSGQFSISVPANARMLVMSYVGMEPQEINVNNKNAVRVTLNPSSGTLTDVVVVGYGRARRANLTSAQTSIGTKEIEKTVNTTLEQALQGRAAGVYVTQNSGQPGGGISVNIRGINSLGRTQPLYVIDGVQIQVNEDVSFGIVHGVHIVETIIW